MPAKQLLIYATFCDQKYAAARIRKDYTNSGAISQARIKYKDQYGEPAHPNGILLISKCWHDLGPRSGGLGCIAAGGKRSCVLLLGSPKWALPPNLAAGGNAVFPPKGYGVHSTRSTADPLRRTTREEAPLLLN